MNQQPSVAIIMRVMDRADELRVSLPSLLGQDYPDYTVVIVDHSSEDGFQDVVEAARNHRLKVLRCPRPPYFNRSRAANIGVRYSFSDLLFFLDTGMTFRDQRHLSECVEAYLGSTEIDTTHYADWRHRCGYPAHARSLRSSEPPQRRVYCECECHGLHLLVGRDIFQRIGGLNEALHDWGFEDTDLVTRLELSGYGRIPIRGLVESTHTDHHRVRFHREQTKEQSWERNRRLSDCCIRAFGPQFALQATPGLCEWIEIDDVRYGGTEAPQQAWNAWTAANWYRDKASRKAPTANADAPTVSVVVPTRNAAEYLVGVLDSILSQDYPNIECLVVDGGSTDATHEILASYGDRIAWTSRPDRGAFDAINRGWILSRGQILAWLNADDSWTPGAVTAAVESFRQDPSADLIYGDCLIVDGEGQVLEHRRPPEWDLGFAVETCHHMIDQPASFIRRKMAQRVGWLYPAWFHDWELWRRVSLSGGGIRRVPHLLGCARVRRDNSQYRPEILIKGLIDVTRRFFSLPGLPTDLPGLRPRALSNCYLRIVQTLQHGRPESRGLLFMLRLKAVVADPSNLQNVIHTRIAGRRPPPAC